MYQHAEIQRVSEAILQQFAVDPSAISLDRGDGLFQYALRAALFNRLMSITVSAQTLEANFTSVISAADRAVAFAYLKKLVAVFGEDLGPTCFVEIGVHAAFSSKEERDKFFSAKASAGLESAGVLGYKQFGGSEQLIRLEIDQSWVYSDAAFIVWRTIGMQLAALMEYVDNLWKTLFAFIAPFDLELKDE